MFSSEREFQANKLFTLSTVRKYHCRKFPVAQTYTFYKNLALFTLSKLSREKNSNHSAVTHRIAQKSPSYQHEGIVRMLKAGVRKNTKEIPGKSRTDYIVESALFGFEAQTRMGPCY